MGHPLLEKLLRREDLTREEAAALLEELLAETTGEAFIAAVLTALAMKGEAVEELVGFAETMRAHALRLRSERPDLVDTAGTGGSRRKLFNVSTAAAIVIAAAGAPVAKHGNRAASSRTGSADVLAALGVRIDPPLAIVQRCLDEISLCFMLAPRFHRATARVAQVRRQLGIRTIFNLLGPLTNPAGVRRQLIGVSDPQGMEKLARAAQQLGAEHVWIVHGSDGMDEITLSGPTHVVEVRDGQIRRFLLDPHEVGLALRDLNDLSALSPEESAATIRDVLTGDRRDTARDLVLLNAAAGLHVSGHARTLREGMAMAAEAIATGAAWEKLRALIALTNEPSSAEEREDARS
ncbi:MAG: anthranilate phosphoribosyltransferase [Blastocatellia bacterium]|nr:anthranilate phosphoribosyltransferase [Blastocatellia bacterium]MCS7158233.1 anthranilate phosphoribosyltransferase [Blastocatellia bacterium]MCX7753071.1 anthranilate phosphoribosyltransferase [Blastocatellia bacterium]MDW8169387.1 anthranilate phosphoribosyltransferase [Acidobacteriota bacterium]MDW8256454.1 anthranilate phosphoribosyltransferase [Acidobacteriota bacterium]